MVELALEINPDSKLFLSHEVKDIQKQGESSIVLTNKGDFEARYLVFCAGLQADRLARKDGVNLKEQVVGFRGDYYELTPSGRENIENKTYGVCRVTGLLIPKERLRLVPHATMSIDAKNAQKN